MLLTGLHAVADIYCECCKTTLGWKYVSMLFLSATCNIQVAEKQIKRSDSRSTLAVEGEAVHYGLVFISLSYLFSRHHDLNWITSRLWCVCILLNKMSDL